MADHPAPRSSRYSFDAASGRLIEYTATGVTTLFAWPVIQAFKWRVASGKSVACKPDFVILPELETESGHRFVVVPGVDGHTQRCLSGFCSTIPPLVRRTVARFPGGQWDLLAWVARGGLPAADLLQSNPALAFSVANCADFSPRNASTRSIATQQLLLPNRKQTDILARLGFSSTERVRRVLRKIGPTVVTVEALTQLRDRLQSPTIAGRLAHVPAIGPQVMAMIDNGTIDRVSVKALEIFARADEASADDDMDRLVAAAARVWGPGRPEIPPSPERVRRPKRRKRVLAAVHAEVTRRYVRLPDFPPAPVPGTHDIVPILFREALFQEGQTQQNCVADYEAHILSGKTAVYQVWIDGQRSTLSLTLQRGGRWVIGQLKAARNMEPSPGTVRAVNEWLAASHLGLRSQR